MPAVLIEMGYLSNAEQEKMRARNVRPCWAGDLDGVVRFRDLAAAR